MPLRIRFRWIAAVAVAIAALSAFPTQGFAQAKKKGDRNRITADDIAEAPGAAANAFDLVQTMRPQWLQPPLGRIGTATVTGMGSSATEIVLYVDGVRQPALEELKTVRLSTILELRYLDQNRAIQMHGPGHEMGVIEVSTSAKRK